MMNTATRIATAAAAITGVVVLGACSAELEDGKLTVTPDEGSVTVAPSDDDSSKDGRGSPETTTPENESDGGFGGSDDESTDEPTDSEGTESSGDNGAVTEEQLDTIRDGIAGLTILALPESGEISQNGLYDCGGQPVSIPTTVEVVMLTGACPEVSVGGSQTHLFVDSEEPTQVTIDAGDVDVLLNRAANVSVAGDSNAVAFSEAATVAVAGTGNKIAFGRADAVTVPASGQQNEIVFLEASAITVDGSANAVAYQDGPRPADNGTDNQIVSGAEVGAAVAEILGDVEDTFVQAADLLRNAN